MSKKHKKQRKRQKGEITSILLKTIEASALVSMAILAPNAIQSLGQLGLSRSPSRDRYYIKTATTRLRQRGLITFERNNKKGTYIKLTTKGKRELAKYRLHEYEIPRPRFWDGRYRLLIFDISEERRNTRDKLRAELENLGFYMVQQSAWIHPYNCEDIIILLKSYLHLGKDAMYMVVERIQNDQVIKKHFNLS